MNLDEVKERAGVKVQCDSRCGCIGVYQGDKVNCFDEVDQFVMIIHRGKIHGQWIEHPEDERRARAVADAWNDRLDLIGEVERLIKQRDVLRGFVKNNCGDDVDYATQFVAENDGIANPETVRPCKEFLEVLEGAQ